MDDFGLGLNDHSFCFDVNESIALYRNLYKIRISQESISVRMLFAPLQLLPE
jgi:hypothetical protein